MARFRSTTSISAGVGHVLLGAESRRAGVPSETPELDEQEKLVPPSASLPLQAQYRACESRKAVLRISMERDSR